MKRTLTLIVAAAFTIGSQAQAIYKATKYHAPIKVEKKWKGYNPGDVEFHDEAPFSEGSKIYHNIIPNPAPYIQENALRVLQTLYWGPKDPNVPRLKRIVYTIKDYNGISEKYGSGDYVGIRYSTNWIERCFAGNDTLRLDYETRGVLYHELTHAYQLSPEGCGQYDGKSDTKWTDYMLETGHMERHTVGVEGGNDRAKFYTSLSYTDNNGIVKGDKDIFRRLVGQINAEYKVKDWMTVGVNTTIDRNIRRSVSESSTTSESVMGDVIRNHGVVQVSPSQSFTMIW